ncbi:MAG: ARMT1-like domain-containing protein [Thermodesulfobacteriota bacterium]
MKTAVDCLPCFMRQALQVVRICTADEFVQHEVLKKVASLCEAMDMELTPPENSIAVYGEISRITGCDDPYETVKKESNCQAMDVLPAIRDELAGGANGLAVAFRFSIAGNIIDYGAMHSFDIDSAFKKCRHADFALDHSEALIERLNELSPGGRVLYLADNSGEIAYDTLVVERLAGMGLNVTVAVKSAPIINDALEEDARQCGLHRFAAIVANGTSCPGTPLDRCSGEFRRLWQEADCIISKGQGNFETLSGREEEIFFLLTVKCTVVGTHLAELAGLEPEALPGRGEMVLFQKEMSA